jgi:hypothetical protein
VNVERGEGFVTPAELLGSECAMSHMASTGRAEDALPRQIMPLEELEPDGLNPERFRSNPVAGSVPGRTSSGEAASTSPDV